MNSSRIISLCAIMGLAIASLNAETTSTARSFLRESINKYFEKLDTKLELKRDMDLLKYGGSISLEQVNREEITRRIITLVCAAERNRVEKISLKLALAEMKAEAEVNGGRNLDLLKELVVAKASQELIEKEAAEILAELELAKKKEEEKIAELKKSLEAEKTEEGRVAELKQSLETDKEKLPEAQSAA